jgi:parallel beta-helix repeat protein
MKLKGIRIVHVTCLLSILLVITAIDIQSATWIVRSDGTGDAPTIQAAINGAAPGDTILVSAGLYQENSLFCDKDNLTLMSVDGPEHTILEDSEPPPVILTLAGLEGFTLKGFTLRNCSFHSMYLYMCSDVLIDNNIFFNNSLYAIVVELGGGITIHSCLFYGNASGIRCMDASGCAITNNTISHNALFGVDLSGLSPYGLNNNLIAFNDSGVLLETSTTLSAGCNDVFSYSSNYSGGADPTGTDGNISADPQYCASDPLASGNFWIQSDSPCSPGNHPAGYPCGLIGKYTVRCGSVSTGEKSWGEIKELYR